MGRHSAKDFGCNFPAKAEETKPLANPTAEDGNNDVATDRVDPVLTQPQPSEGGAGHEFCQDNQQRQNLQEPCICHPSKINRGGENYFSGEAVGAASMNPAECVSALCCYTALGFVIVGGIVLACVNFNEEEPMIFVGTVILMIAAGACLFGCCTLCIGQSVDGLLDANNSIGQSKADPNFNEVQVRFRRLNDRHEKGCLKAEDGLQHVRLDVVGHT